MPDTDADSARSIASLRDWADAIADLGALTARTVLVPSEAHAHALRVELLSRARRTLAGTRFLTIAAAARAVLDWTDTPYRDGEELRRGIRLHAQLRGGLPLASFEAADLLTPGWEQAFVETLAQLEHADLRPSALDPIGDPRAADLSLVWRRLDEAAGASWTAPRLIAEAAAQLEKTPAAWPFPGPVLGLARSALSAVEARFLRAVPQLRLAVLPGRPARPRWLARIGAWFGSRVARLASEVAPTGAETGRMDELGILAVHLFESPQRLAQPDRRRSAGPDGSVTLELHAGASDELDATVRWVAEQIFEHRAPLHEVAVLVPAADPWTGLVADRLAELAWPGSSQALPVHIAGGRLAISTGAGARLLAIVRALEVHLPLDAMLEVLPRLRRHGDPRSISRRDARAAVRALATRGGSPARPEGAGEWRRRLAALEDHEAMRGIAPAVEALLDAADAIIAGAPLVELWRTFEAFVANHVVGSRQTRAILELLGAERRALDGDPIASTVHGLDAIRFLGQRLSSLRLGEGRYGEPSVYVGTISDAAGLAFSAVRIIGISEGVFPGILREDPIFPGHRATGLLPLLSDEDFTVIRLHAFEQVIRGVRDRLAISASRADLDGTERGPAAVFVELAAALGRPNAITGGPFAAISIPDALARDAFRPAREALLRRRDATPLTPRCWHDRVARGAREVPGSWSSSVIATPSAIAARAILPDGELGLEPVSGAVPGLCADRPLSASALAVLLVCPRRFLLERLLDLRPLDDRDEPHRISSFEYGHLVHRIAERFARDHGDAFGARAGALEHWLAIADALALRCLDEHLEGSPLACGGDVEAERRRLRRDIRTFVEHDWAGGRPRTFVAAEHEFGEEGRTLSIETTDGPLYVRGRIDRLDIEDGALWIRDLKTGRAPARRREPGPNLQRDVQLVLYVAVAQQVARGLGLPALPVRAAYVHLDPFIASSERSPILDAPALARAAAHWLGVAAALLRDQLYVPTPDRKDCERCPFSPVCRDTAPGVALRPRDAAGTRARYLELRA